MCIRDRLPGETLYRKLKENGVLVRWFDADRIRDYIRITIGSMEQMETLVELSLIHIYGRALYGYLQL